MSILLVPDLLLEQWPSMTRYADSLARELTVEVPGEAATIRGHRYWSRYVSYPRVLRRYRPSLVHISDHSYAHCLASFRGIPSVVTIHDLWPLVVLSEGEAGLRDRVRRALLERTMRWLVTADRWIAVSEFTKGEAVRLLGIDSNRITVVRLGADGKGSEGSEGSQGSQGSKGSEGILLHVGSCVDRKRVEIALGALSVLRRRGVEARLLQIGGRWTPGQLRLIERLGIAQHVRQEADVPEDRLAAAYRSADLLLMPSSYEGFGLPALEACVAGLPVVSSGAGGLREAAGAGALIVPDGPAPADAWADAIAALLSDEPRRRQLAAAGRAHARSLTWQATAAATQRVYDSLGGG